MEALVRAAQAGTVPITVAGVVSNRPRAGVLGRAGALGIRTRCIDHRDFAQREAFDAALREAVEERTPDLVVLAGFMRVLTPVFIEPFRGRLLNIHPSLLPRYPGLDTHQRAIDAGDRLAGATVHFVTEELDGGPAVAQVRVPVLEGDDAQSLAARVLAEEHRLYPEAVRWFAEGRLRLQGQQALLDGEPLPIGGRVLAARRDAAGPG